MQVNPADYNQRRAYLIGYNSQTERLPRIENIGDHLVSAKQGLMEWGFKSHEILTVEKEEDVSHFLDAELTKIRSEDARQLVFIFFKGHGIVKSDCMYLSESINLESFLRNCASAPKVDVVGLFDCCRRDTGVPA